jgi:Kef-type K+ transport system membrane component KefB/voltage-gated potassium channel Kch
MMNEVLLWDIGFIIVSATLLAHLARLLRQPLIPAYVLAGIVIGPLGLRIITDSDIIRTLSELGIAFLLFIVGLELDLRRLRDIGVAATAIAIVSAVAIFALGAAAAYLMGFTGVEAVYIGIGLTFSSTMIVIKILSDKNELETLHGRIILGVLLMQDVLAIMALSVLTSLNNLSIFTIAQSMVWGLGLFSIAIVGSRYVIPTIFKSISKSHELMFLTALSFFFLFARMSEMAGFSVAIGAFVAGMAIATFPYNLEVVGKVRSLRDFFAIIFFVSLGLKIWAQDPSSIVAPSLGLLAIVLIAKPAVMVFMTSLMGYGRRVSFLIGLSLFQVSEFSMIIAMQGLAEGNISAEVFSIISVVALVTITLTSYAIKYDNQLYRIAAQRLMVMDKFSKIDKAMQQPVQEPEGKHAVILGCHRLGYSIAKTLQKMGKEFLVVDFNPERVKALIDEGLPCIYGDIGDIDVLDKLHLKKADLVISTINDDEDSMLIISEAKFHNRHVPVVVTAENVRQALELYDYGADYVIVPRMLSGVVVADIIEGYIKYGRRIDNIRDRHVKELLKVEHEETLSKYEFSFVTSVEEKIHDNFESHKKK